MTETEMPAAPTPRPCPFCGAEMIRDLSVWVWSHPESNSLCPADGVELDTDGRLAAWNRRAVPPGQAAMAEALRALVDAKALSEVEEMVAGWNGPPEKPYERHPSRLGATIRTNCGRIYELADAMAVARSALAAGAESGGAVLCIERAGQEMDAHIEMARIERGKRSRRPPGQAMNPYPGLEEGEEPGGMPFGGQGN